MGFPTTLIFVMIISVVSVVSTLALAQGAGASITPILAGSLYFTNPDGSTTAFPSGTTVDIVSDSPSQRIVEVRIIEGVFVYALSVAVVADVENFHLEVDLPTNSFNYDPPARALRYSILPVKLIGVVVGYVPGRPTPIRA